MKPRYNLKMQLVAAIIAGRDRLEKATIVDLLAFLKKDFPEVDIGEKALKRLLAESAPVLGGWTVQPLPRASKPNGTIVSLRRQIVELQSGVANLQKSVTEITDWITSTKDKGGIPVRSIPDPRSIRVVEPSELKPLSTTKHAHQC